MMKRRVINDRTGEHCTGCGREMVDVEEHPKQFSSDTGEPCAAVWRQCPKYPRNGTAFLFTPGSWKHESHSRDNPFLDRRYR